MEKDKHALLVKAINVFNPDRPLSTADELEKYYVARLHAPLEKMSVYLRYSQQPVKLLFSGHMGSGKSTELARLSQGLQDKFLIVHVTRQDLNRPDLTYLDVLLVSAVRLFRAVFEIGCPVKVDRDLIQDVFEWFSNEITQETTIRHDHAGGLVAKVNLLLFNLQKKFADEVSTRETIRERLYVRLKDMLDRVNALCAELEKHGWPPLILFEPSDKANREQGKELFFTHAQELILPECRMVYTFPIALCYTSEFGGFKDYYSKNFLLPNINVYQKEGNEPDIKGMELLKSIITRRVDPVIFQKGTLDDLVLLSGGHVRNLIRMVADAAVTALTEGLDTITREIVAQVGTESTNDYRRSLSPEQYEALRDAQNSKRIVPNETVRKLLENLSLLEYRNGDVWCDVNPVIKALI